MFSPSPHYNSGGHSGNSDNNPVFFRDPDEYYDPNNSYYTYPEETLQANTHGLDNLPKFKHSRGNCNINLHPPEMEQIDNYSHNPFKPTDRFDSKAEDEFKNDSLYHSNRFDNYKSPEKSSKKSNSFYFTDTNDDYQDYDVKPKRVNNRSPEHVPGNDKFYYNNSTTNYTNSNNASPYNFNKEYENKGSNSFDIYDSPIKNTFGKYTESTACDYNNGLKYVIPKAEAYHTSIKINDSGSVSSLGSQKLSSARKQLVVGAYFKSFKMLSLITILFFLCAMISVLMIISCVSNNSFCYPKFEIQTSGLVESGSDDVSILDVLTMQPLHRDSLPVKEDELALVEKFLDGLSGMVLDSSFNEQLMRDKISEIFESEDDIVFKFSNFGYCKEIENGPDLCHPYFGYGLDVPSVFIKDLAYTLSSEEIEGDAEYVSNVFVENYRGLFHYFKFSEYKDNQFLLYGMASSLLSGATSYMTLMECVLDILLLLMCVVIAIVFKSKANKSLCDFKNYLFESNLKRHYDEQNFQFARIEGWLIMVTSITWICTILRALRIVYEVVYIFQIETFLKSLNLRLIEGIKLVSSGTIFDVVNVLIHLFIAICLTRCIVTKPWIIKASL